MKNIVPIHTENDDELKRLDELELLEMINESKRAISKGDLVSQEEVKSRLKCGPTNSLD
jgi:hypothetical protein